MPTIAETFDAATKLHDEGKLSAAERLYREILQVNPRQALVWQNLGLIARQRGQAASAIEWISRAILIDGAQPSFHNNLGAVLQSQSRLADAIASYSRAIALKSDYAEAHCNLGSAHKDQGRTDEAMACYSRALQINPKLAEAHFNLGVIHQSLGELAQAAECYQTAIGLKAGYWQALNNLGTVYKLEGRFNEALVCYEASLASGHDPAEAHRNRALLRLLTGDYAQGWPEYEWRFRVEGAPRVTFPQPRWDGRPLDQGTLLLKAEQGLGDTIQFIRYAPLVRQRASSKVILHCAASLQALLQGVEGIDRFAAEALDRETFDCYAPLMSLPGMFGTQVETIPAAIPYLTAEPARVARWRSQVGATPGLKVGIAWQGNPGYAADSQRSVPLEHFVPLSNCPGVRLYSLQKYHGCDQLALLAERLPIVDLGPSLDLDAAFVDTAAVMVTLDLVVTSDSAMAHLAGALGVKVWVALPNVPDWRWLLDRDDSPWYPTMRLFRQSQPGDWPGVFERIAHELNELSAQQGSRR